MKRIWSGWGMLFVLLFFGSCQKTTNNTETVGTEESVYLDYAAHTAEYYIDSIEHFMSYWRGQYKVPENAEFLPWPTDAYLAALYANLYSMPETRRPEYLEATKTLCLNYGDYREIFLQQDSLRVEYEPGLPVQTSIFQLAKYTRACEVLFDEGILNIEERKQLENDLAECADFLLVTQEWGPMNRSMLRTEALLYIAKLLPEHPRNENWLQIGNAQLQDNLNNWTIEDASLYNLIWMYSLCGYAYFVEEEPEILLQPSVNYYFKYFQELLSPEGAIPDYGDGWWRSWWGVSVPIFELGASINDNPELKWAADYTFHKKPKDHGHRVNLALRYSEAYLWGNKSLKSQEPTGGSAQVLDDQVGKKVVFRNGYNPQSTYLLLNYKDEGSDGWLYRENLRNTLSAMHEKMHHGHSDENSVVLLMHNQSVLLRDAGYRDVFPSGENGSYRADIFHNRLVVRNGLVDPSISTLNFLKNDGHYIPSTTHKIDFYTSQLVDHSRTQLVEQNTGYIHDRIVDYIPSKNLFVVTDMVKSEKSGPLTLATLWHTQQVLDSGKNWAVTRYESFGKWKNPGKDKLYIQFARQNAEMEMAPIRRHKQDEIVLSDVQSTVLEQGEYTVFVTLLAPLNEDEAIPEWAVSIDESNGNAIGISIGLNGDQLSIVHKIDLAADVVREWPRPRYTPETGSWSMNEMRSDAQSFYCLETEDEYHIVGANTTHIQVEGQTVFQQKPITNEYRADGGPATKAAWKVRLVDRKFSKAK